MKRVRVKNIPRHVDIQDQTDGYLPLEYPPTHRLPSPSSSTNAQMPSEQTIPAVVDQPQADQPQGQVKVCSSCHSILTDTTSSVYLLEADAFVCSGCREHVLSTRATMVPTEIRTLCVDLEDNRVRQPPQEEGNVLRTTRCISDTLSVDQDTDTDMESPISHGSEHVFRGTPIVPLHHANKHIPLSIQCSSNPSPHNQSHGSNSSIHAPNIQVYRRHGNPISSPDPLIDITRIRVRSQGHPCLYPGASFQGTQKSGRNSYDVNVTIVDVDFTTSFLCGYLRIRGLTEDWPELTTYFDAEIIGSRYGFMTQNWGANEQEDMVHWSRFPAFRHVKNELKGPHWTMPDRDRGAVFMRWKERFLVPDHRVQDINGASFAGFYYVCVAFNPLASLSSVRPTTQTTLISENVNTAINSTLSNPAVPSKPDTQRARRDSSNQRGGRSPSLGPRSSAPVATMSGFYFHQNSEPYQQLSLCHVPEHTSSSFEFR